LSKLGDAWTDLKAKGLPKGNAEYGQPSCDMQAGLQEVFYEKPPGYPDNTSRGGNGTFWI
jgi:hypothetical protein